VKDSVYNVLEKMLGGSIDPESNVSATESESAEAINFKPSSGNK
jgi:hypothetical protein